MLDEAAVTERRRVDAVVTYVEDGVLLLRASRALVHRRLTARLLVREGLPTGAGRRLLARRLNKIFFVGGPGLLLREAGKHVRLIQT